jgi:hypothetical protein
LAEYPEIEKDLAELQYRLDAAHLETEIAKVERQTLRDTHAARLSQWWSDWWGLFLVLVIVTAVVWLITAAIIGSDHKNEEQCRQARGHPVSIYCVFEDGRESVPI